MQGVLNYGCRPTFQKQAVSVEVHLLDFKGDLYDQTLEIAFGPRLREEKTFESPEQLKSQIEQDILLADRYLKNSPM